MATADLHFHSTCSDGKHSVDWIIKTLSMDRAQDLKLAVLTDHDGVSGFEEFAEGVRQWWTPICASELSCTFFDGARDRELHLLVYGLNPKDPVLQEKLKRFREEREKRFFRIGEKLRAAGYQLDLESLAEKHPGVLGRPHIADALVEAGHVKDRSEAFSRFLKSDGKYYVAKWRFPLEEAVAYAKKNGCKTSIAHPGPYHFREKELQLFSDLRVDAIEIFHPRHDAGEVRYYRDAAKRFGFAISGGSDFHSADVDLKDGRASLGRSMLPFEEAAQFLKELL
jgi:predicted metal-dependent phosphoesterase TrpH